MARVYRLMNASVATLLLALSVGFSERPATPGGPLLPREEQATFRLPRGFHAELVACEPDVIDPVSMCFDAEGRMIVAEMQGYPNAGVGTGPVTSGRIKILEDRDGDGYYETSRVYVDNLRLPTGVQPYRDGLLIAQAPDILYLKESGGAVQKRVLYTGFALNNIQQMINTLQWGLDNWVYGCADRPAATFVPGRRRTRRSCRCGAGASASIRTCRPAWSRPAAAGSTASAPTITGAGSQRPTASTSGTSSCPTTICAATLRWRSVP